MVRMSVYVKSKMAQLSTRMQGFINRWNDPSRSQILPKDPNFEKWNSMCVIDKWDFSNVDNLLDLCSVMGVKCTLRKLVEDDYNTWGVDHNTCVLLYNYIGTKL